MVIVAIAFSGLLLRAAYMKARRAEEARMDQLVGEIQELRGQIEALKAVEISTAERDAIRQLIADAQVEHSLETGQAEQRLKFTLACADRAALKYGLTPDQRSGVADVLLQSQEKVDAMETHLRDTQPVGGLDGLVEAANEAYRSLKAWRLDELTKRVGPDLARRLDADVEFGLLADAGSGRPSRLHR